MEVRIAVIKCDISFALCSIVLCFFRVKPESPLQGEITQQEWKNKGTVTGLEFIIWIKSAFIWGQACDLKHLWTCMHSNVLCQFYLLYEYIVVCICSWDGIHKACLCLAWLQILIFLFDVIRAGDFDTECIVSTWGERLGIISQNNKEMNR